MLARVRVCARVNRCVCQRTTPTALALTATPRWPQSTSDLKATHARGCVRLSFRGTTTRAAKAVGAFGPSSDLKATHARGCVRVRFRRTTTRAAKAVCAGNGRNQKRPLISAPRSEQRPRCPPGCSCGPQTPSYATRIAKLTQEWQFSLTLKTGYSVKDDRRQTAASP